MKRTITSILIGLFVIVKGVGGQSLEKSTPEEQGVSSQAILDFVQAAEEQVDALHSFILLRHGKIIAQGWWEPYQSSTPHMLYSLSKSFTSTAIGLAIEEGRISLDDTVISFFPEQTPKEISNNLKAMRIRDLLSMNTGHQNDTTGKLRDPSYKSWVEAFLAQPVEHKPGTHFVYNSGATYMLSAIIQKVTGSTLLDYLKPRLFDPLGIVNPTWEKDPQGINTGGWGLKITTEDIAKFGQLYLQKGLWQSRRLLTEQWVNLATFRQTSNGSNPESDWEQGYGYQFWRCRHNIYRGDGAFGQYCIVMPEQDAVLAMTGGLGNMQTPLNLAWEHLLPAMQATPLAPDNKSAETLEKKLTQLILKPVKGESNSAQAKKVSDGEYIFDKNAKGIELVSFDFNKKSCTLFLKDQNGEHSIHCGFENWEKGVTSFDSDSPRPVAASGAWENNTYECLLCFYETPYVLKLKFQFENNELICLGEYNVAFGPTKWESIKARKQ